MDIGQAPSLAGLREAVVAGGYFTSRRPFNSAASCRQNQPARALFGLLRVGLFISVIGLVTGLVMGLSGCDETFDGPPIIVPAQLASPGGSGPDGVLRLTEIKDGDTMPLLAPPQGGFVLYAGVMGKNLSTRSASLLGELRRSVGSDGAPLSQPGGVLYSDERSVRVEPLPPGTPPPSAAPIAASASPWQEVLPDPNQMANIPTCPNFLDVDIVDNSLFLVVRYSDRQGRTTSAVRKVVPRCQQASPGELRSCVCQCLSNYASGGASCLSALDAGVSDSAVNPG
jgi:hypothetical protein